MISEETDNRPNPDHEGYDHVCHVCDQGYYGSYCEYCAELADATAPTPQANVLNQETDNPYEKMEHQTDWINQA